MLPIMSAKPSACRAHKQTFRRNPNALTKPCSVRPVARGVFRRLERPSLGLRCAAGYDESQTAVSSKQKQLFSPTLLGLTALSATGGLLGTGFGLEGPQAVLQAIAVLAAVVTIHECGHFLAARLQGIHVTAFSIGFGPILWAYKGGEVEYTLRAFPLGGYVAFPEDDGGKTYAEDDPDLLKNRSVLQRALVISAGVIANCIFAYAVLLAQVSSVGIADAQFLPGVKIPDVTRASAAEAAGLRSGDLILSVDGRTITAEYDSVSQVISQIRSSPGRTLPLTVQRNGRIFEIPVVPDFAEDGNGRIGAQLSTNALITHKVAASPNEALSLATGEFNRLMGTVVRGVSQLFSNFSATAGQLSGPVAIVAAGSEIARADASGLFQFAAIVNINLAVVNTLPLPALDGGYMALLIVEAARGRKLPDKLVQGIQASGLLLMLTLGAGLMVKDTLRLLPPL